MGHGNGWPSSTATASAPSQNRFGLNPTAPGNDYSHQYFGEGPIAEDVRLAKRGRSAQSPLLRVREHGTRARRRHPAQARQRADNYAAGFIKAGAAAVIAEAYDSPNNMIRRCSAAAAPSKPPGAGRRPRTATGSPSRARRPVRRPDGSSAATRVLRSIVLKGGLAASDVLRNARRASPPRLRRRSTPSRSFRAWPVPASCSPPRSSRAPPWPRASSATRSRSRSPTATSCRRRSRPAPAGISSSPPRIRVPGSTTPSDDRGRRAQMISPDFG